MNKRIDIDDLIGIPYKEGGRDYDGLDCYGLGIIVCAKFGYYLPDVEGANRSQFVIYLERCLKLVQMKKVECPQKEADIILIKDSKGILGHMGVYLGDGLFIHCDSLGVRVEKIKKYESRIGGVYSWLQ